MAYATITDLQAYMATAPPPQAQRMLARASDLLDGSLALTAVYSTDVNGLPTNTAIIAAFKDAVCAQVEWWAAGNDEMSGIIAPRARKRLQGENLIRYVGDY